MKKTVCLLVALLLAAVFALGTGCGKKGAGESAGTVNGLELTRPVFVYSFNYAADALYREQPALFDNFGTQAFADTLKNTQNDEGVSYFDVLKENTLNEAHKYLVAESLARAAGNWPSDSDMKQTGENAKAALEQQYATYITYYGYTIETIVLQMYGILLEDYMEMYPRTEALEKFNSEWKSGLTPTDAELAQFYEDNVASYRIVTVRHSLLSTEGLTAAEKAEVLAEAESYVEAVKAGTMSFDDVVALSEDTGVSTNGGYYDVYENAGFVKPFEDWAVKQESTTEIPEIVETEYGYHLMICTAIQGYESEDVQQDVEDGWRAEELNKYLEGLMKEKKYELKNRSEDALDRFTKMCCTLNFDDPDATDAPAVTPTPKPEYNDAPLNTDVVAKLGSDSILYPELVYMFSNAMNEIVSGDVDFDSDTPTDQRYQKLRELLDSPYYENGMTYMEKVKERTVELLLEFRASYRMALAEKTPYTDEQLQSMNDEIDETVDYYLTYAGDYYGVTTRDEYMQYVMGMNVSDYKYFNAMQQFISEYAESEMAKLAPTDDELRAYYDTNEAYYRVVAVRHIYLAFADTDGDETVSDAEKQAVRDSAASLVKKYNDGDSPEALVRAWSQADDATTSAGIVNMSANSAAFNDEIRTWAFAQNAVGLGTLNTFETEDGVEVIYVTGILTFDGLTGETGSEDITHEKLLETLGSALKNELFDNSIKQYCRDNGLELTDVSSELIDKCADAYLTYQEEINHTETE